MHDTTGHLENRATFFVRILLVLVPNDEDGSFEFIFLRQNRHNHG